MIQITVRPIVLLACSMFTLLASGKDDIKDVVEPNFVVKFQDIKNDAKPSAALNAFNLVKPHAADSNAVEPLAWIATQGYETDIGDSAVELLVQHHLLHVKTIELAKSFSLRGSPLAEVMLRAQRTSAELPHEQKGKVMLSLARFLQKKTNLIDRLKNATGEETKSFIDYLGEHRVAELKQSNVTKIEVEAIALFNEVGRKYAKEEIIPGLTIADFTKSAVFDIQNLRIGMTAPDIVGNDLSGESFSLSDYRGNVVLLSFWASWCGPCMAEIPHEREITEMYKDKPFVIVGVNADPDLKEMKPLLAEHKISWRSFWCGADGPIGSIPTAWNISSWPTTYLLDCNGVIRGKGLRKAALEEKISELVSETGNRSDLANSKTLRTLSPTQSSVTR